MTLPKRYDDAYLERQRTRLERLQQRAGLSCKWLAWCLDLHPTTVSRFLRGVTRKPSADLLHRVDLLCYPAERAMAEKVAREQQRCRASGDYVEV